jgi:hypothetical protein
MEILLIRFGNDVNMDIVGVRLSPPPLEGVAYF